ncbi:hypothetical protein OsJ_09214 [Oryza sativa Japonica Group]|uniref:Uncharacterized protein n=1 Tax=Oryza sativa subsp. japonica TaxID=39947 RepID=B9FAI6_ORYSJ|nr:hypothetical protein OsJ_09214 [Oryza sativa Japonica Group]
MVLCDDSEGGGSSVEPLMMLGPMVDLEGQLDREGHVAKASTKKVDGDHRPCQGRQQQMHSGELLYIQLQASNFMRVEFVDEDYINGHGGQLRYMQMQI